MVAGDGQGRDAVSITVLIGGDTVYAFSDADEAAMQYTVMVGSNLDVEEYRITPDGWARAKAAAIEDGVEVVVEYIRCRHCNELIEHERGWVLAERDGTYDVCDESEEGHMP